MIDLPMPLLCVSACLLGQNVRYDGGHKLQRSILRLPERYSLLAACPEAEAGLGIPREQMRLEGSPASPHAIGLESGYDFTRSIALWCRQFTSDSGKIDGFILKSRSPSCGTKSAIAQTGRMRHGPGLFAGHITKTHPLAPVIDEERFSDHAFRESFLHRAEALSEWKKWGSRQVARFHARHHCLAIAHNPRLASSLGGLVNNAQAYIVALMKCLSYQTTEAKALLAARAMRCRPEAINHSLADRQFGSRFTQGLR